MNIFQDQHFGGQSSLSYFTALAPRRYRLDGHANPLLNQGNENSCEGYGSDVGIDIFCRARGQDINFSPEFLYWNARKKEQGTSFNGSDTGIQASRNVFVGMCMDGVAEQSFMEGANYSTEPSAAAWANAATHKATVFERLDYYDYRNAVITAVAHDMAPTVAISVTNSFMGITSDDEVEQLSQFNYPSGKVQPGSPDFYGYHALDIVGYDLDLDCAFLANSWGKEFGYNGIVAVGFPTLVAQTLECYTVREFNGLTSYIDPKYIVAGNSRFDSGFMKSLRQYMYNVLTVTTIDMATKARITRDAMPIFGVIPEDLADAFAPWGVTLADVNAFLAL